MDVFDVAAPQVSTYLLEQGITSKRRSIPQRVSGSKVRILRPRSVSSPAPPGRRWREAAAAVRVGSLE
jgi:hypothetical protein